MPDLLLRVNGQDYAGWTSVKVTRGIESIANGFDVELTDRWSSVALGWPIREEDRCAVILDGEQVISGYVDRRTLSIAAEDHRVSFSGRDRAAALVDNSARLDAWEFYNISVETLAKRLGEPFGVPVVLQRGIAPPLLPRVTIDPGDTAFDTLDRSCKAAGVLPISDGRGGVILARAGNRRCRTALVEGQNILAISAEYDSTGRYARYLVIGQHPGEAESYGIEASSVRGEASDNGVRRHERILVLRADGNATCEQAVTRAQWEAKVRAARVGTLSVVVQGWSVEGGGLWPVNALVRVDAPSLAVAGEMLITQAVHSLSEGGSTSILTLRRRDAFLPEPVVPADSVGLYPELNKK